jgi:hypothetical protein
VDLSDFEQRLDDYTRVLKDRADQAVVEDAWSKLLALAIELRGPAPRGRAADA